MALTGFLKSTIRLLYRLTVGLTVLLLRAGLLYLISLLVLAAWVVLVGTVTWQTYVSTGRHTGWTACVGGLTGVLSGCLLVAAHRGARDWLGLPDLALSELLSLVFLGRRPARGQAQGSGGGGGDGERRPDDGRSGAAAKEPVQVMVRKVVMVSDSSSTEVKTGTATRQTRDPWRSDDVMQRS